MKCPKCETEQADAAQCSSCGIYVEKYENYLALKAARQQPEPAEREQKRPGMLAVAIGVSVLLIGLGYLVLGRGNVQTTENPTPTLASGNTLSVDPMDAPIAGSIRERFEHNYTPKNEIERARNATVFIQTEWGASGSGFIVDSECRVITNRHVVELDESKLRNQVLSSNDAQSAFQLRRQALILEIEKLRIAFQQSLHNGGSSDDLLKLRGELEQRADEFDSLAETFRTEVEGKVHDAAWKSKMSLLKVSLVDGTEYLVNDVQISDHYDLATFKLRAIDCPFLVQGNPDDLAQGGQLFTIGNPSGLTYTVTSGVFSGFREENGRVFLQTDAPINPGNSGGPLIDPNGRVVGINTMVLKDAQNIGFSIPVTAIDEAF